MAPFRIAVLGAGVVGRATLEALLRDRDRLAARAGRPIEVVAIAARTPRRLDALPLRGSVTIADDPWAAATSGAPRPGITGIDLAAIRDARARGERIRLVAEAGRTATGIEASVVPQSVPLDDPLA